MPAKAGSAPPPIRGRRLRIGGGDLPVPKVDPKNPDVLYTTSTVTWRSEDGGSTWTGIRGAPGGDDYQNIWINPNNPNIIFLVSDQGALISENYGRTWTTWYNQPTAQLYHVVADNGVPYRVCAGQQDSGSLCLSSRGNDGEITFRDWHPVGVIEYGYAVPDPLNPNIIYGAGRADVTKYDWITGQVQKNHADRAHLVQIPHRPHAAADLFAEGPAHSLFRRQLSVQDDRRRPHLANDQPGPDARASRPARQRRRHGGNTPGADAHRGAIYSIAPSFNDVNTIWVGTDDGNIQLTRDGGKTWKNVTPAGLEPWSKVTQLVASRFDEQTAYASVSRFRVDDLHPYIYRTHDGGKTWQLIVTGIADHAAVDTVREDPVEQTFALRRHGECRVGFVRWWRPLAIVTAQSAAHFDARSLDSRCTILIVATHGRGFWILDDITPLEQLSDASASGRPPISTNPKAPIAIAAIPIRTRRCRPKRPLGKIRRMARSSIIPWAKRLAARSRSRFLMPPANSCAALPARTSPNSISPNSSAL